MKKMAFTLAEVMITLTIIGVISAIVVPVAVNSRPDENVMKFKKAHNTLYQVINTLVTSDKYYCNGDLGIKADCETVIKQNLDSTRSYLCQSIADLLSTKTVNCVGVEDGRYGLHAVHFLSNEYLADIEASCENFKRSVTPESIAATKEYMDFECRNDGETIGAEIIATDGTVYYATGRTQYGDYTHCGALPNVEIFSPPNKFPGNITDDKGIDIAYKGVCIDIDGIPENATKDDCVNECPFGYGIRRDGKIMNGARADEWLEKDIQAEN